MNFKIIHTSEGLQDVALFKQGWYHVGISLVQEINGCIYDASDFSPEESYPFDTKEEADRFIVNFSKKDAEVWAWGKYQMYQIEEKNGELVGNLIAGFAPFLTDNDAKVKI